MGWERIEKILKTKPSVGIILGSGLGSLAERIKTEISLSYNEIPGFPVPLVSGHKGSLISGKIGNTGVLVFQGRLHYYEGCTPLDVTFPVSLLNRLDVKTLIVTNAAGGISRGLKPGDLMLIIDHINLMGINPLMGLIKKDKAPFVDLSEAYDRGFIKIMEGVGRKRRIKLKQGVLAAVSGPSYETPAEIRMLRSFGADAVCMSTVPEVIMARYYGMRVLGVSLITNKAAGLSPSRLSHEEVVAIGEKKVDDLYAIIEGFIQQI